MIGAIQPLPYQLAVADLLETEYAAVWAWFASNRVRNEHADAARLDLLKTTYRLEPETHARAYALAAEVRDAMALTCPVTLYQAQAGDGLNAALLYVPGEAHVIFAGPLLERLDENELRSVIAHELAHYVLFEHWDGRFLIATDVLGALGDDGSPPHLETFRLMTLFAEMFCDRAALLVSAELDATVTALLKIRLGLTEVSAESYLRQADEIFSRADPHAEGLTHPEIFFRARGLRLWSEQAEAADAEIERMVKGPLSLAAMDLLDRRHLAHLTRRIVDDLMTAEWMRTDAVLAHARLYFPGYTPPGAAARSESARPSEAEISATDGDVQQFFTAVLLDFATADRSLDEVPLAQCFLAARALGLEDRLATFSAKELGLGKRALEKCRADAVALVAAAGEGA